MRIIVTAVFAATVMASAAPAAVVINPIAPVQPGLTVGIAKFTTVPATTTLRARTGAQGLQGIGDRSGRLFIHDTRGIIYVTNRAGVTPTPYLDLRTQGIGFSNTANATQAGLMGIAFHPNFGKDRTKRGYNLLYTVDTTAKTGGTPDWTPPAGPVSHHDVVREWTVADPKAASAAVVSTREVTRLAQSYSDHGPGQIAFNTSAPEGSADYGKLYIGLGDGGGTNDPYDNAQNLGSPFGKIMRIDRSIPMARGR